MRLDSEGLEVCVGLLFHDGKYEEVKIQLFPAFCKESVYERAIKTVDMGKGIWAEQKVIISTRLITRKESTEEEAKAFLQRVRDNR